MSQFFAYFRWPLAFTMLGLLLSFWLGYHSSGTLGGAVSFLMIAAVLSVLEISLSFDNAIVNANKLKDMEPAWQRRFLTWGIAIAVFGMRIVFPLAVVSVAGRIDPWSALVLAAAEPREYARLMHEAHISIAAFGGTFLMMVALTYFIDQEKDVDWFRGIEERMRAGANIRGLEIAVVLVLAIVFTLMLPAPQGQAFLFAAICGLVTFLAVDVLGQVLDRADETMDVAAKGGLGAFLYLEVLDASFSFDGVIGAFALTQNLFLIAIGLGIGAFYVRSMTILLVEKGTLAEFRYLEHGAFYSILVLAIIMYLQSLLHVPEMVTGLIGACLIGWALVASIRHNRREGSV
ncbi:DUF475 domain-containing protein [Pseudoruegeria sp. HB172150]|uniref:DUF475 domain-containing protein n=1 Tax=Pseudoruegeria sp. HB172150 TaxID=2721164 RepID=UPI0015575E4E|nr:DUF475 domain-containing protein [Pseudoruegeria sp. HB172150]